MNQIIEKIPIDERSLVKKFDFFILSFVTLLYFSAYVARINISNVHDQLLNDIGISELEYSWLALAFFLGYIFLEVPSNIFLKRLGSRIWLGFMAICWGIICSLTATSRNFSDLLLFRIAVGCFEAGVFPGILYFLRFWYKKQEMGFRFSLFFSSALLAGSFMGIFSFFVLKMNGILGIDGWRWLLILEGIPGILLGLICIKFLPRNPGDAWFLRESEKLLAVTRLHDDDDDDDISIEEVSESDLLINDDNNLSNDLNLSSNEESTLLAAKKESSTLAILIDTLKSPKIWLFSLVYMCICLPMAALSFFLPKMVQMLGFDSILANLITAPIYLIAAVFSLLLAKRSDMALERPLHICFSLFLCSLGLLGLAAFSPQTGFISRLYFNTYCCDTLDKVLSLFSATLAVTGATPAIPLFCTWLSSLIPRNQPSKMAVQSATIISIGQVSGILAPLLYPFMEQYIATNSYHVFIAGLLWITILCILYLRAQK